MEVNMNPFPFPHKQLDVYNVALHMAIKTKRLAAHVPRGYRSFADQLLRAAGATVLLIAEGANRFSAGSKRRRYSEARGECGEVAAAFEFPPNLPLAGAIRTPAPSGVRSIRGSTPTAWGATRLSKLGFTRGSMQPEPSNLLEIETQSQRHKRNGRVPRLLQSTAR
jgi:four helix bundle protein